MKNEDGKELATKEMLRDLMPVLELLVGNYSSLPREFLERFKKKHMSCCTECKGEDAGGGCGGILGDQSGGGGGC